MNAVSNAPSGFLSRWLDEHCSGSASATSLTIAEAKVLEAECRHDASRAGISDHALDAAVGQVAGGGSGLLSLIEVAAEDARDLDAKQRIIGGG